MVVRKAFKFRLKPSDAQLQKMQDLEKAFKDAFDKKQPTKRLPKFKRRGFNDSFRFPGPKQIHVENRLTLPQLGWIGFHKSRSIEERKVQKIHIQICNMRDNFQHKLSTNLSKNHAMIVTEGLKISNMSKSSCGTIDNLGRNVKEKSDLNKSILDQDWNEFRWQLKYKLELLGEIYVVVNPSYTSQKCASCSNIDIKKCKSQSKLCCIRCAHTENADVNAAKNILAAGHAELDCEESVLTISMNQ